MFATEQNLPVALWIDTPALGDTIAATPTLRKLSKAFNDLPLTVFTSNPSLFDGHPLV
jgi:ADP-heptose:LPS heptosyltransferase